MSIRFTKNNVLVHIETEIKTLYQKWGFDSFNGWHQVEGAPIEKIVAYGKFNALNELHRELFYNDFKV